MDGPGSSSLAAVSSPEEAGKATQYVGFILDSSGSMGDVRDAARTNFNEQVQQVRNDASANADTLRTLVSLITFNTVVTPVFMHRDSDALQELAAKDYSPGGMTALRDAVGHYITECERLPDINDPTTSVLLVIVTDGYENASVVWKQEALAEKIQSLQGTERWTFTYLGANQDLATVAGELHIPVGNVRSFHSSAQGLIAASMDNRAGISSYFSARSQAVNLGATYDTSSFYEDAGLKDQDQE